MNWTPWFAKEQDMPNFYQATVRYLDGKHDIYNIVEHTLNETKTLLTLTTHEDICVWIPLATVKSIEFDKAFTKVVELNRKFKEAANAKR